ncbi:MAG: hypothetical protein JO316_05930 [Abitibacteriaceae bacterium]|nr:hypothetical protein [Abditibacteriaceae bacterium]
MNSRPVVSLRRAVTFHHPVVWGVAATLVALHAAPGIGAPAPSVSPSLRSGGASRPAINVLKAPDKLILVAATNAAATGDAMPSEDRLRQASGLISEALDLGQSNPAARAAAVRGAASLIPRLAVGNTRSALASRWINLVMAGNIPRALREEAFSSFFDAATQRDPQFARMTAGVVPDAAARAGAFVDLSEVLERMNWQRANEYASMALSTARTEPNALYRAKALTFVSDRITNLNPQTRPAAVREAAQQVRSLGNSRERDYLLANVVGTAAKFDIPLARRMTGEIGDNYLKGLATARVNLAEISQTTLMATPSDRIAALAKAAARYDTRAIPILLQLPPQADVLKTISRALPAVYPTSAPTLETSLLERMWTYAGTAEASVYRDELQSRLARLMVLHDPWRGRTWGRQLAWKGGRIQVGAFLHQVMAARRSAVRAEPLQDLAERNINRAIIQAHSLPVAARTEALLLIAGQILG